LIAIAAIPVVKPRPQSNKSFSGPARISVLIPFRCALKAGPEAVPSRITLRLESPFVVVNPCGSILARSEINNRKLRNIDLVFILPLRGVYALGRLRHCFATHLLRRPALGHSDLKVVRGDPSIEPGAKHFRRLLALAKTLVDFAVFNAGLGPFQGVRFARLKAYISLPRPRRAVNREAE